MVQIVKGADGRACFDDVCLGDFFREGGRLGVKIGMYSAIMYGDETKVAQFRITDRVVPVDVEIKVV